MELIITARHMDLTPEIEEYANKRILPVTKFFDRVIKATLVLTSEKHRQHAELTFVVSGKKFIAKAKTSDMKTSIDEVSHKMERIMREHHDKMTDHKKLEYEEQKKELLNQMAQEI